MEWEKAPGKLNREHKTLYNSVNSLHCMILIQDTRPTVQTEQAMNRQVRGAGPLMRQQNVLNICGTVVCSMGVFYLWNRFSEWSAHKRNNTVIICDETGGFFYDSQEPKSRPPHQ